MADFSQLAKLDVVATKQVEFVLDVVPGSPKLFCANATDANKRFLDLKLKLATKSNAKKRQLAAGKITSSFMSDDRDEDRVAFAQTVIVGWDGVKNAKGEPVAFTQEECLAFLNALPDWLFDEIRNFCKNPVNFVDLPDDLAGVAGN